MKNQQLKTTNMSLSNYAGYLAILVYGDGACVLGVGG